MKASLHQKNNTAKKRQSNTGRIISIIDNSLKAKAEKRGGPLLPALLEKTIFIRLIIASILLAATLIIDFSSNVRTAFIVIAVLFAGCDIFSEAVKNSLNKDVFSYSGIITVSTIIAVILGYDYEAFVMILLYRLCIYLIHYTIEKTKASAIELIDPDDADIISYTEEIINNDDNLKLRAETLLGGSAKKILAFSIALAVIYAILLPLLANYTFKASIYRALSILLVSVPFSVTAGMPAVAAVGLGYASSKGSIFSKASVLEKFHAAKVAVFNDKMINRDEDEAILSIDSGNYDEDTFMNLVSNLVYNSDQWFARAIIREKRYVYMPEMITDFEDFEGFGVKGSINSSDLYFGTLEFIEDKVNIPIEETLDADYYHLVISNKYIGSIAFSRNYSISFNEIVEGLKGRGVAKCILLSQHAVDFSENDDTDSIFDITKKGLDDSELSAQLYEICSKGRYKKIYIYSEDMENHSNADIDVKIGLVPVNEDVTVIPEYINCLPESMDISRRMSEVAKENALFVFIIKAILIFLAMIGFSGIWFAVFIDLSAALATILNAIRVTSRPIIKLDFLNKL